LDTVTSFSFFPRLKFTRKIARERDYKGRNGREWGKQSFAVSSLCRRFMDSARFHLKDYIEQTITNRPFFFVETGSIPCPILYDIAFSTIPFPFPLSSFYSVCLQETKRGEFELLFDDDASPSRHAAALFYEHPVI